MSGFAQTNNAPRAVAALDRTAADALRLYVPHRPLRPASEPLPANLSVPPAYRALVESMLWRSPTFRRQCQRIASTPNLEVTLHAVVTLAAGRARARTRILRRDNRLHAWIEVLSLDDPAELIAHELEHVIEQLDEVDLASKSAITASGVELGAGDAFETTRAKRVGLAVAAEVRRAGG